MAARLSAQQSSPPELASVRRYEGKRKKNPFQGNGKWAGKGKKKIISALRVQFANRSTTAILQ